METVILGSGISGISAGYHLQKNGEKAVIYERDSDWGGLCGNFTIDGFRFDKFVHFTFAPDDYIKNILKIITDICTPERFKQFLQRLLVETSSAKQSCAPAGRRKS